LRSFSAFSDVLGCRGICHSDGYDLALNFTCDLGSFGPDEHVYFAAHAELGQVNPRLDRETRVGQDAAFVVDFEIVHVGAVGVNLSSDALSGAVTAVFAKASAVDE